MTKADVGPLFPGQQVEAGQPVAPPTGQAPRLRPIDRNQSSFRSIWIEDLVEAEHPVRAIWDLVGQLDLREYYRPIQAVEGTVGRPHWDPRLLISLWVYSYSRGISSARELAGRCEHEPAFQWLCGLQKINHHTLSDFRSNYQQALEGLFVQVLGVLSAQGLVGMERLMHDGTKIKAQASKKSFQTEAGLKEHLQAAQEQVAALSGGEPEASAADRAARKRAAQERHDRVKRALEQLNQLRAEDPENSATRRISCTDPEARVMKQPDGGYAPAYNVQLTTDAQQKVIVAVAVSDSGNDFAQLEPAIKRAEQNLGRTPRQVAVDAGYTTRGNLVALENRGIEVFGPCSTQPGGLAPAADGQMNFEPRAFVYEPESDTYRCPVGTVLTHIGQKSRRGAVEHTYRAHRQACAECPFQDRCCRGKPGRGRVLTRVEEPAAVVRFRARMATPEAQEVYRTRSQVAEFPHAWIKDKLGLRKFRLRGLAKVGLEALWACLTYNIQQWIRLAWAVRVGSAS